MSEITIYSEAVKEIKNAILQSRYRVANIANREMLSLYYNVGQFISENSRAGKWGTGAIDTISEQLQSELPGVRGFSPANMKYMRIFHEQWSPVLESNRHLSSDDLESSGFHLIIRQLPTVELPIEDQEAFLRVGFTHHREILINTKELNERWYYIRRCAAEFWTVLSLKNHLRSDDYRAFGQLPNNFSITIPNGKLASRAVQSFKDEYLLDFINIEDETDPELIDEPELHAEIVTNIQKFIMSLGKGFCWIGSKYRIIVDDEEFFVDLQLYSRPLRCLVAIELKRGAFKPAYLGQLNFYLSALDEYVKLPEENPSIGIILCREAKKTKVEFAVRDFKKPMGVATYKFGKGMPEQYKSLIPVVDGIKQIIEDSEISEDD